MNPSTAAILEQLQRVNAQRQRRLADSGLAARVQAVKQYQHQRFSLTYADLLASPRHAAAAAFFLEDLYGPHDFSLRDAQFARVVPALVRLFPQDIVATVQRLGELHALSELLDTRMGEQLRDTAVTADRYVQAWQACGTPAERAEQIALMLSVGAALDKFTRNPLLRQTLRLMRKPAQAAGLAALQTFLERGFDTFRAMRGADDFLQTIASREGALATAMFAADAVPLATNRSTLLVQLP